MQMCVENTRSGRKNHRKGVSLTIPKTYIGLGLYYHLGKCDYQAGKDLLMHKVLGSVPRKTLPE